MIPPDTEAQPITTEPIRVLTLGELPSSATPLPAIS
ncbi:hypothetical protein Q604_UNBC06918G0002, partial [human gut metagenome]